VQYDITIAGRTRHVLVQKAGDAWRITLDGRPLLVQAAPIDGTAMSLLVRSEDGSGAPASVRAVVAAHAGGQLDVHINGRSVAAAVRNGGGARRRPGAPGGAGGAQRITAPMPGKVVRVLVSSGDTVTARQGLVVVEAMKMENELRAARDGRVVSVEVTEGQSVDAGAVLAVVE
jgi:biotin carboxyl carrier protein